MKLRFACSDFFFFFGAGEEIGFMVFSLIVNFFQGHRKVSKLEIDLKKESDACLP